MHTKEKRPGKTTSTYIFLLIVVILSGMIFLVPFHWTVGIILLLTLISIGGLFLLVRWHAKNTAYICPNCGHTFMISTAKDFLSPHWFNKKLLKCPKCGKSSWCEMIEADSMQEDISTEKEENIETKPTHSLYLQIGMVLLAYLFLWVVTLYIYSKLPETIPTHFDMTGKPDTWGDKSSFFTLPLFATILPVTHGIFCLYAAKQGYRSAVYTLLTFVITTSLLIFAGLQFLTLSSSV